MKFCFRIAPSFVFLALAACSSKKGSPEKPVVKHVGHETEWDHEKIRAVRELEAAEKPTDLELKKRAADEDSNCSYMSESQMKRSQASGCRPVDPRAGMGANMFCCPKE